MKNLLYVTCVVAVLMIVKYASATIGFAEWQIQTPGNNLISHIDPLKERYSTCLRPADRAPGSIYEGELKVYVSHLRWWQYYNGYVVGKGNRGYFIFNEKSAAVEFFIRRDLLEKGITKRRLGNPTSKKMLPGDGWAMVWGPKLEKNDPEYKKKQDAMRKKVCEYYRTQLRNNPQNLSVDHKEEGEIMCGSN
mgnify:FL=1